MKNSLSCVLRIGTRASPLARVQAEMLAAFLARHLPAYTIKTHPYTTKGDQLTNQSLIDAGGKGLFTGEIDAAIAAGDVDLAVHSLKDMPSLLPDEQEILAIPERADPREGLVSLSAARLADLPEGAVLGTASIRRKAQALVARPDLNIVSFRGSVGTRLDKLRAGQADATFLAMAGLSRLGQGDVATPISVADMCPAPCQGLLGITGVRARLSTEVLQALAGFENNSARRAATIERAFLAGLDGSCRTPIAAHAQIDSSGSGIFAGEVYGANPSDIWRVEAAFSATLSLEGLAELGNEKAVSLKTMAGEKLPQFQVEFW